MFFMECLKSGALFGETVTLSILEVAKVVKVTAFHFSTDGKAVIDAFYFSFSVFAIFGSSYVDGIV